MAQQHVGLAFEAGASYGVAVPPTDFLEGAETADLQVQREIEELSTIRTHAVRVVNLLSERVTGTITMIGNYQELGLLLKAFYGIVVTSGVGPWTHTYPGAAGIPSTGRDGLAVTVEVAEDASLATRYAGCKVTSIRISGDNSRSPRVEASFIGKSAATATPTTFVDPGFEPILIGDTTLTVDSGAQDVQGFDLTLERGVDEPFVIGSTTFAREPRDAKFAVSGSHQVLFENNDEYDKFLADTEIDLAIAMTDATHSLTATINKAKYRAFTKPVSADSARVISNVEWIAWHDTVATTACELVLVNDDETIPAPA